MAQTVTLQLPDNVYYHAKRAAEATQKAIEEVLITHLSTAVPPLVDEMTSSFREALRELEAMNDDELVESGNISTGSYFGSAMSKEREF